MKPRLSRGTLFATAIDFRGHNRRTPRTLRISESDDEGFFALLRTQMAKLP